MKEKAAPPKVQIPKGFAHHHNMRRELVRLEAERAAAKTLRDANV